MMLMLEFKNIKYLFYDESKKINTILLPGFLQTNKSYQSMFDVIRKYSNLYVIEFPGFGITKILEEVVTLDYFVIYLNEFIKKLNLKNVILFGHSFGGRVIIKYEALYNNSISIILMDAAGIKDRSFLVKFKIFKYKLLKKIYKIFRLKKHYQKLIKNSGSSDYQKLTNIEKQTFNNIIKEDLSKMLKKIATTTLIIWGEQDTTTPICMGLKMNKQIMNSHLIIVENAHHFPHIERPIFVNNVLDNFYQGVIISLYQ